MTDAIRPTAGTLPATTQSTDDKRETALLRAIGFDKLSPEQRELALAIATRYDLDPMLKHIVMIEGRPYITRDGLLHVAHKDGSFDGMETTEPVLTDGFWRSTCSVYRKDMSRPFTYTGRYPEKGKNAVYAPEMAVKVGEVMALRRAFDVAAPTETERWGGVDALDAADAEPQAPLTDRIAARAAALAAVQATEQPETAEPEPEGADDGGGPVTAVTAAVIAVVAEPEPEAAFTVEDDSEAETTSEPEPAAAIGVSPTDFASAVKVAGIPRETVQATAARLFPSLSRFADLTDTDRAVLLDTLVAPDAPAPSEGTVNPAGIALCGAASPLSDATCTLDAGHSGAVHRAGVSEAW